jgi:phage shock protein PspC (stress-responsive transcriptional regulator)
MQSDSFWRAHDWFWRVYDWAVRLGISGLIASAIGGGVIAGIFRYDGWDPPIVLLAVTVAFAAFAVIYIGFCHHWDRRQAKQKTISLAAPVSLEANIDASVAFFDILENSDWSREQKPIEHPISDWLSRRLDDELHNRLYQNRLKAWGRRCLNPIDEAPEGEIPADEWAKIEIDFVDRPRTCAMRRGARNGPKVTAFAGIKFSKKEIYAAFPPTSEEISLFEAATITYERIRNHSSSVAMEVFANSGDDILIAVCQTLTEYRGGHEPLLTGC